MPAIGTIQSVTIFRTFEGLNEIVEFIADADEDNDGSGGNPEHDPCHQDDTTLHGPDGRPLNAYKVPFIVVPPLICEQTKGVVLGSMAFVRNITTGQTTPAVVGDIGPRHKIGEISPACAKRVGLHITAFSGEERHIVHYRILVGKPAMVDGVTYSLKPYR